MPVRRLPQFYYKCFQVVKVTDDDDIGGFEALKRLRICHITYCFR